MSKKTVILVSGVGAIIGYGILRVLRHFSPGLTLLGTDIYPDAFGQVWTDKFIPGVLAKDDNYIDFIRETVLREQVSLFIPGIEQDGAKLSAHREQLADLDCRFVLNNPDLLETSTDKWLFHQQLKASSLPFIASRIEGDFDAVVADFGLPFLLKPRRSYASKGIVTITCKRDFDYHRYNLGDNFMVQEIVGDENSEYTASIFGYNEGASSRPIIMRRELSGEGATSKSWLVHEPELENLIIKMATVFRPEGPTNFQFRYHEGLFLPLEINPRISSATSLRAAFGWNEPAMCISYYLKNIRPNPTPPSRGAAIRYIDDYICRDPNSQAFFPAWPSDLSHEKEGHS